MQNKLLRWMIIILLAAGMLAVVLFRDHLDVSILQQWVEQAGAFGALLFVLAYAAGAVLFFPGSVLTLAGGVLFGPVWGTLLNLSGATIGAGLAFIIARYLGADWVRRRTGPRLARLSDGVAEEGWRFVAFVRLVPLFPFNLLNYALGLTRIPFVQYLLATWVFMLPGALAYTYLGYAGREAATGGDGLIQKALVALALLAVAAFLPRLIGRLREPPMLRVAEVKQRLDSGEKLLLLDLRSAEDFGAEQEHLAMARNVPLEHLTAYLSELEPLREQPVMLICGTDKRSAKARRILNKAGFTHVHAVQGGMTDWLDEGWPVSRNGMV